MVPINISLNFILIPIFGSAGAAIATLIGNISYVIPLMIESNKLFNIYYPVKFWIISVCSLLICYLIMLKDNIFLNYIYLLFSFLYITFFYLKLGGINGYFQYKDGKIDEKL